MCITNNNLIYFFKIKLINIINTLIINNPNYIKNLIWKVKNKISTIHSTYTLLLIFN